MKPFIHTYDDAFTRASPYTQQTEELKTTLQYIFDQRYSCYLLCVKDKEYTLFKLESKGGDPILDKQINKTLKRKKIKSSTKTWRRMGCIIKPFKKESTFAKEWIPLLDSVKEKLPNGVFVLSLSDSVLLPSTASGNFLPVYAYSGKQGYKDIPIPTYDDLFDSDIGPVETNWSQKKDVAVFRGSSTGCGYTKDTNQRLHLASMKSEDLDVGITQYTSHLKINSATDIGQAERVAPVASKLSWKDQSEYKYLLHVDGNVVAYRLLKSMLTKSVVLRVKSDFVHWADKYLEPNKHYIEIKADLSDLKEKVDWCKSNDVECKKIAKAGYTLATKLLASAKSDFVKILSK
jgi:hypothetical protein